MIKLVLVRKPELWLFVACVCIKPCQQWCSSISEHDYSQNQGPSEGDAMTRLRHGP